LLSGRGVLHGRFGAASVALLTERRPDQRGGL